MSWIAIGIGLILLGLALGDKPVKKSQYLEKSNVTQFVDDLNSTEQAINLASLTERTFRQKMEFIWRNIARQLGNGAALKLVFSVCVFALIGLLINRTMIHASPYIVVFIAIVVGVIWGYVWLQEREKKQFNERFPDALNMLSSAVSAGESITHAIAFVGKKLEGDVGKEFKIMGERLQLGESPDEVFKKSCIRFPYPAFRFFVITLRANMNRGGQLRDVISRLNRLMFDARAVERKKYALTSEARISAKIVCATPFFFLFILQFLSPENYEFVMFHAEGRPILYYVLISEAIGMLIIWGLLKGTK
ncbi:type II secretion system F family protein [Aliivibrio fischeri]|uniref:type II secretion system F family protein n=1 Tax=Aliivibrio fischeri TaxID=668 RepID=UPI0012D9C373|nr:type II secretion system F family protein [Aliivibrio fischeri]MUK70495.1 pilus assembly protein TadB [Aliivibrio fischeri]MUK73915.1 pilus assembly protein TadB [Aliivibrio fischeri]MUK77263.1 pilus assembly protein TadB [Aliivibrio fischeri]